MKIYIACALTHVPRDIFKEYADFIHSLAGALNQRHEVKYALINSDPQLAAKPVEERARLCYLWDREMVEQADLLIAECSFSSTGLGIELQVAEQNGTPIIMCFKNYGINRAEPVKYENPDNQKYELQIGRGFVSLMALGVPAIFKTIEYSEPVDGVDSIVAAVDLIEQK